MEGRQYRSILNAQGLNRLAVPFADPAARMGIGEDERHNFLDMKVEYVTKHTKVVIPDENSPAYVNPLNRAAPIEQDDFPDLQYLGDPIASYEGV